MDMTVYMFLLKILNMGITVYLFLLKIPQHGYDCIHVSVEDPPTCISLSLLLRMLLLLFQLLLNFYVVILFSLFL
jgi:hypothetical protein